MLEISQTNIIRENSSFEEPGCISVSINTYSHLCKLTMKRLKKSTQFSISFYGMIKETKSNER